MRIRITMSPSQAKKLKPTILPLCTKIEEDETNSDEWELIALIDPGQFKVLNELLQAESTSGNKGGNAARIETLSFSTAQQGDEVIWKSPLLQQRKNYSIPLPTPIRPFGLITSIRSFLDAFTKLV